MNRLKLGWIGLGNMGIPMATNLLKAGFELSVFNRSKEKEQELIALGASSAANPKALIENCDVVLTMLSDDAVVKTIFEGEKGLLSVPLQGKLIINMNTVSPETSKYLAAVCNKQGIAFLEAPVSGSVKPAQDGTLLVLVAGTQEDYEKALPIFNVLGKLSLYLGAVGSAGYAKLAINYLLALNLQGLAETVLFAEKNGIAKNDMLRIINESACGNEVTKSKSPAILKGEYPAASALRNLVKDIGLAREAGINTPLVQPLFESYQQAQQKGLGEEDVMAIIKSLAQ